MHCACFNCSTWFWEYSGQRKWLVEMVTPKAILLYGIDGKLADNSEPKIGARSGGYSWLSRAVAHRFRWAPVRTRINIRRIEWSNREALWNSQWKDLAASRSGFMVWFLVGFFDLSGLSSLDSDFDISIGVISYNAQAMFLNARVSVLGGNRGHISRHS